MGDAKLDLLKAIMDAYPFEGGGNCIKAAVFHSHMLNTFKPAFDQLPETLYDEPPTPHTTTDVVPPDYPVEEE